MEHSCPVLFIILSINCMICTIQSQRFYGEGETRDLNRTFLVVERVISDIKITLSDVVARWIPANLTSMLHFDKYLFMTYWTHSFDTKRISRLIDLQEGTTRLTRTQKPFLLTQGNQMLFPFLNSSLF